MEKKEFKSRTEELLEKLEKTKPYSDNVYPKPDLEKSIETDILMDFTNIVHAFDNNHPINKVLIDTFPYNFTRRGLSDEQKRVLEYLIKKFQSYLDDFVQ